VGGCGARRTHTIPPREADGGLARRRRASTDEGTTVTTSTDGSTPWVARSSRSRTVVIVLLAIATVAVAAGVGVVWYLDASVDRVGVDGLGQGGPGTAADANDDGDGGEGSEDEVDARALTVLVLGSDSREVLTAQERRELNTGMAWGERTEVISLVRLDPRSDEVRVLSVPRDSLVTRCDDSRGRVNAAYGIGEEEGIGGATCVVQTLRDWLDVRIDHVVKVDFRGFVDIVDAIGGVSMHIDRPLRDRNAGLDLDAGCQRLDGADALAFVRARHIDDDFGRMGRQQRFAAAFRDELGDQGVLSDLPRLLRTAEATARAVELDDTLTIGRIQQLVRQHRSTLQGDIDGRVIPGTIERQNGFDFLITEDDRARELVRWLVTGRDVADLRDTGDADDAGTDAGVGDTEDSTPRGVEDDDDDGPTREGLDDLDGRPSC
jgi:LCP family protein required for cell wall assembly